MKPNSRPRKSQSKNQSKSRRRSKGGSAQRPLLLLDVDGPLNPFAARFLSHLNPRLRGYRTHRLTPPSYVARLAETGRRAKPLRIRLNPAHGPELLRLECDLVWATAWGADANAYVAPAIGLPQLPVIEWPEMFQSELDGLLWKTRHIVAWADGRPFAWVDDAITRTERRFVAAQHPGPALLHHVDPRFGLQAHDFAALARWAAGRRPPAH